MEEFNMEKEAKENEDAPIENETEEVVYVSVLGMVQNPGVYVLKKGSRIYEAINEAGGVIDDGDISAVNLVDVIEDYTPRGEKSQGILNRSTLYGQHKKATET